jgi:ribosomal-protein-alanine N-acetyltransferase
MDIINTKSIITDRCVLYPLTQSDFDELTPLFTSEEVRRYLGGVRPVEDSLSNLNNSIRAVNEHPFVARLNETHECIGYLSIAPHHNPVDMEISNMFLPEHWGNGYAEETVKAVLAFCEQKLNLSRVVSETQTANIRSCRLLEKLGYRVESYTERFGAKQTIYVYDFKDGVSI